MATARQSFTREAPDQRRAALIEATLRCLARHGAQGTSVRAICAEAGVSPGLLRHYFAGIDQAIAEAYRWTGARVQRAMDAAAAAAPDEPRARLLAYLGASFRPPIADPELLATWLAFWSLARTDPRIAAIRARINRTHLGRLEALISACGPGDHSRTATALTALVDGLWLELSLGGAALTGEGASALVEKWLDALLGQAGK